MRQNKEQKAEKKSHAKSLGITWLIYLIMITLSLSSITLSKYVKTVTGTATATIAATVLDVGEQSVKTRGVAGEWVVLDGLSEDGYCTFRVKNYNADGVISQVPMEYTIQIAGADGAALSGYQLFATDENGNVNEEPMDESERILLAVNEKQCDTYVIQFDSSVEDIRVTILSEQVVTER